jgi:hypothetical protein
MIKANSPFLILSIHDTLLFSEYISSKGVLEKKETNPVLVIYFPLPPRRVPSKMII